MPGDPLQHLQPGDPEPLNTGRANAISAASKRVRGSGFDRLREVIREFDQSGIVRVKNISGATLNRFDVVGLGDPIVLPSADLPQFKSEVTFEGDTPTTALHAGKFAIMQEPCADDKIAPAVVSGVTVALIDRDDVDFEYADVKDGDPDVLLAAAGGGAHILWCESSTGTDLWALVRISNPDDDAYFIKWAKAQYDWEANSGDPRVSVKRCDRDGTNVVGDAFWVYLPRSTSGDPAIFADAVLAYQQAEGGVVTCASDYMDDKIDTVKMWIGAVVDIPAGWRLCNGSSGAFNMSGRFPLGLDVAGRADEDAVDDTGGHRWHGQTENNHPNHPNHRHALSSGDSDKVDVDTDDPDDSAYQWASGDHCWTSGQANLSGETTGIVDHFGTYNSNQDTDNRPPYRVIAFIERYK